MFLLEGRVTAVVDGTSYDVEPGGLVVFPAGTPGTFEVFEVVAPAAPMAPPHVSPWSGGLYLLEGRVTALVDGTPYDVEPGGLVVFPAGTPSTFGVVGESARFLGITSGDGAGRFFADFAGSVPADRPVEVSMEAILSVTQRHGVRLAGR